MCVENLLGMRLNSLDFLVIHGSLYIIVGCIYVCVEPGFFQLTVSVSQSVPKQTQLSHYEGHETRNSINQMHTMSAVSTHLYSMIKPSVTAVVLRSIAMENVVG